MMTWQAEISSHFSQRKVNAYTFAFGCPIWTATIHVRSHCRNLLTNHFTPQMAGELFHPFLKQEPEQHKAHGSSRYALIKASTRSHCITWCVRVHLKNLTNRNRHILLPRLSPVSIPQSRS
jgi:hypothetical protein